MVSKADNADAKKADVRAAPLSCHLEASPALADLYRNLNGTDAQRLSYPSMADARTNADLVEGLTERVIHLRNTGKLKSLGLSYHWYPHLDRTSSNHGINLKDVAKSFNQIKKTAPDSISRIVTAAFPSASENSPFEVIVAICTLSLSLTESLPLTRTSSLASGGARLEALGSYPELQPICEENPENDDIVRLVRKFIDAPKQLRTVSAHIAKEQKDFSWRNAQADHQLALFQMDAMLPTTKALSGAGQGEQILRIVLTAPVTRANNVKKDSASMDRDDVNELFWSDALARHVAKPPYVKL
jgi:hypothetical protein